MKRSELQVGGVYLFSESNNWTPGWIQNRRCVILSLETGWDNRYTWTHYLDQNKVYRSGTSQRFPVALEAVEWADVETNPETGEPWTPEDLLLTPGDLRHYLRRDKPLTKRIPVARHWYPWAARSANIKAPWQVQADAIAAREADERAAYPGRLQAERDREAKAEQDRIDHERRTHERQVREAQASEFYEQRIQPRLVELGVAHDLPYGPGDGHVRITHEELARLLDKLDG